MIRSMLSRVMLCCVDCVGHNCRCVVEGEAQFIEKSHGIAIEGHLHTEIVKVAGFADRSGVGEIAGVGAAEAAEECTAETAEKRSAEKRTLEGHTVEWCAAEEDPGLHTARLKAGEIAGEVVLEPALDSIDRLM